MRGLQPESVRNILIRSVNWVGDAVMTTPAISVVRACFPHANISLLANETVSELFVSHPGLNGIITFYRNGRHSGLSGRLRLASELRRYNFDLAIIFPNSFDSALVPWLAGIPVRIGICADGRSLLLNRRYDSSKKTPDRHEVDYYLDLVGEFDIKGNRVDPHLYITDEENGAAHNLLASFGIKPDDFIVGINPGATYGSAKRWYPERFAAVADKLTHEWGAKALIFGGPGETEMAGDIEKELEVGRCLNMAGKTTIRELMALIKRCNFFITNDSGPMHIAAALDVPTVAIFGSTDQRGTSPYSGKAVVIRADNIECAPCKLRECPTDHRCMTNVTSQDVVDASLKLSERLGLSPAAVVSL